MADTLRATYVEPSMIKWRHVLHEHPELGFEEHRTTAFVAEKLRSFGLEVHEAVGKTGVVGVLRSGDAAKTIGLRADMDALPISEVPGLQYASRRTGVMHVCGHDGHMAMLLGAAKQLAQDGNFEGRVVFIPQPNEENGHGAPATVNDPAAVELAIAAATKSAGRDSVNGSWPPQLFSEDFAHFAAARPACFMLMGNGLEGRHTQSLHAADYDFCDEALVHGAPLWVCLTEHALAVFSQPGLSRTVHDETLV